MGVIDSLAIYRIAAILGADPFHLGVMSSLWSAAFIAGAFVFGYIGDRYRVGVLKILSSILSIFSLSLVLFSSDTVLIIAGYVAHALALSCGRIAISITILESIDPEAWGRINSILRGIYWILRGLVVYLLLGVGFGDSIVAIMAAISLGLILTLPEPYYRRLFYRIEGLLSRIYQGLNGSSLVLIIDSWGDIYSSQIITRLWGGLRDESPLALATSTSLLTLSIELIATPAPSALLKDLGKEGVGLYLAITSILVGIVSIVTPVSRIQSRIPLAETIMTISSIALLTTLIENHWGSGLLALLLATASASYQLAELGNYNRYNGLTYGYGSGVYLAVREAGGLVGGILSGIITLSLSYQYALSVAVIVTLASIVIKIYRA